MTPNGIWLAYIFIGQFFLLFSSYAGPSISSVVLLHQTSVELKRIEKSQSGLHNEEQFQHGAEVETGGKYRNNKNCCR